MMCLLSLSAQSQGDTDSNKKVFITNEATINTEHLEYSPAFYEDGIVFISSQASKKRYRIKDRRINQNIMSIFRSKRQESGLLTPPEPFASELLTPVHEGPLTFDRTNDNMYFTRNNYYNGKSKKAKDGKVKLKIYSATKKEDKWGDIKDLSFNDNDSNTAHPSISVDGDVMYFASDRPGGFGGMDIYLARKQGDSWGEPVNLGPGINTEVDDIFPYIHADGTLYFASKGHSGYGGLDIFFTTKVGNGWKKPANLGKPFNSEQDDFGFITDRDKKNGYFSSNRNGGLGHDDILSYYITTNLDDVTNNNAPSLISRTVNISVIDYDTGDPIPEATVSYMNLDDLTIAKAITSVTHQDGLSPEESNDLLLRLSMEENSTASLTDFDGRYPLKINNSNYVVNVEKDGYQPRLVVITADSDLPEILVSLQKPDPNDLASNSNNPDGSNSKGGSDGSGGTNPDGSSTTDGDNPGANGDGSSTNGEDGALNNPTSIEEDYVVTSTIKEGTTFELPNIYYNFNDASIRPDARVDLDALSAFLKQYPDIEIELASHTDSRGRSRYNRRLSRKRAENVVKYLVRSGIERNRLQPLGLGEAQIRNHCVDGVNCKEFEHQYNRRTEVRITQISQEINVKIVDGSGGRRGGSSEYKVVAGVFQDYSNAEGRLQRLRAEGFDGAEIVSFGNSQRHSVIVGRLSSLGEARSLVSQLKNDHAIRSFIKR
ncbi:MAG: OmpA family protein [Bacteroidota bacterium]